jgi:vitamin B12 transporter
MWKTSLFSALLLGAAAAQAADSSSTELSPVVVTATRTAQTADESLASVTVVDRKEIEQRQARSIEDVLRGAAGVEFSNNGGIGKQTSLFLRGTNFNQTLVLIDGVKVGSATTGATAFQDIPISQIERIEVVRGPRSSLYGSEAIGGVVQIFTRKGSSGPIKPELTLGGGSFDTYNASGGVSGGNGKGWFSVYTNYKDSAGFNACNGKPPLLGCGTYEPDRDGYWNLGGSARAGYRLGNAGELDLSWLGTKARTQFDGTFVNETHTLQQVFSGKLSVSPLESWNVNLSAGHSVDNSDNLKDGRFVSSFDTNRDVLSLQNNIYLRRKQTLTAGVDYQRDQVGGSEDYLVDSRTDWGLFGEYIGSYAGHDLQLSLRRDNNEQFGSYTTGNAAWGYTFDNGLRVTTSYGTAFMAPTFNDLYYPMYGNPDLQPEKSRSIEAGLSRRQGWGKWSLNAYQTKIDDLIVARPPDFVPVNFDKARILGLEAITSARIGAWDIDTNLTLLSPINKSRGSNYGNLLPRRAEQSFRVDLARGFGRFRAGASLYVAGRRFDDPANTIRLDPYALVGLRLEYALSKAWRVQGRIENLLNENYETVAYYNQPGRAVYLTLRYQP